MTRWALVAGVAGLLRLGGGWYLLSSADGDPEANQEPPVRYWHCPNCGLEMTCPPGQEDAETLCPHCIHDKVAFQVVTRAQGRGAVLPDGPQPLGARRGGGGSDPAGRRCCRAQPSAEDRPGAQGRAIASLPMPGLLAKGSIPAVAGGLQHDLPGLQRGIRAPGRQRADAGTRPAGGDSTVGATTPARASGQTETAPLTKAKSRQCRAFVSSP